MRKLTTTLATAGFFLCLSTLNTVHAAPVGGYEDLYATLITSCSLPDGTVEACETAINEYSAALVVSVDIDTANQSFSEARLEVFGLNESDEQFQADIDALFELLLPNSGAIGPAALPAVDPAPVDDDDDLGTPVSDN